MNTDELRQLQRATFGYFLHESNPENGLVADNTREKSPASITAVGLGLAAYTVGVEQGYVSRADAIQRVLTTLRFFWNSPQSEALDATGYKGFFYHFLDMKTGQRAFDCELSTVDSGFLLAGALAVGTYFDRATAEETEIRQLADALYQRADWDWMRNGEATITHGWRPESGFLNYRWTGYDEALLLYMLGLGSPTHPLSPESYRAWSESYQWMKIYGYEFLFSSALFTHQLSHIWIDFRSIQDDYMRGKQIDYFENSRRATYIQQQYAIRNPRGFKGYNEHCWGITASDGPGPVTIVIDGIKRQFYDYKDRGVPDGPDDGTIAPWAVIASLPFAPEIVLPTMDYFNTVYPEMTSHYGFKCSFNPTFPDHEHGWISKGYYGLDQGPVVLMIENYLTGFFWDLMKRCPYLDMGLRRAGFQGGWL